jgi:thymidylate synthase (FAD)
MESLKVALLRHTEEPERAVAAAAKLCYSESGAMELEEGLDEAETQKFLSILIKMGHLSPIEHASFTFAVEGVSRALTHQLVRHRLASYSQQSQRYVAEDSFGFVVPPSVQKNPEAMEAFSSLMESVQASYSQIRSLIAKDFEQGLESEGYSPPKAKAAAEKLANEDARFVLPNACETKIVITMNARELLHFFEQRCCERAQWEIRELAAQMLALAKAAAPILFQGAGPRCMKGKCPEGPMSCGRQEEVARKFQML